MVFYSPMFSSTIDLLFPPACMLCQRRVSPTHRVLCQPCEQSMERCPRPAACAEAPLAFDRACAPFLYHGTARHAVLAFKYHGRHRLGRWLTGPMAQRAREALPVDEIDAVVPVPLHWLKRRLRGSYPAAVLAKHLAAQLCRRCDPAALIRTRWTTTQTRLASADRFRNVRRAFRARRSRVAGLGILLVDDVLTSGATAHACATALREAGARAVYVAAAACASASRP